MDWIEIRGSIEFFFFLKRNSIPINQFPINKEYLFNSKRFKFMSHHCFKRKKIIILFNKKKQVVEKTKINQEKKRNDELCVCVYAKVK